jgi:hypothetical protein
MTSPFIAAFGSEFLGAGLGDCTLISLCNAMPAIISIDVLHENGTT